MQQVLLRTPLFYFFLALAISLIATLAVFAVTDFISKESIDDLTESYTEGVIGKIEKKFTLYENSLYVVSGLVHIKDFDRNDWNNFFSYSNIFEREPGIQLIGFEKITHDESVFLKDMDELREFNLLNRDPPKIHDDGSYEYVFYIYPINERNVVAPGFDMSSETTRNAAITRSLDTNSPALSGPVTLVQEITERKQPGMILYLPVFESGVNINTLEQKRDAVIGYAYSAFRTFDLFESLTHSALDYSVYDITDGNHLMIYSQNNFNPQEHPSSQMIKKNIDLYGRDYQFIFLIPQEAPFLNYSWIAYVIGIPASLIFALFIYISVKKSISMQDDIIQKNIQSEKDRAEMESIVKIQKSKDDFLKMISHEIRTPLFEISGYAELLSEQNTDPETCRNISQIKSSTKELDFLLSDLISLLKLQQDQLVIEITSISPYDIFEKASTLFENEIKAKSIHVNNELTPNIYCLSDHNRLFQIFRNILSNSIDFVNRFGHIRVWDEIQGDYLKIYFSDDGIGMDKKTLDSIFSSFYQKDTSLIRKHGGTGIGLGICKMFVEKMGGTISVDSQGPGKGTTVSFTLKLDKQSST